MRITHCQLNHLTNPLGYDLPELTFSWQVEQAEGKKQTAARIVIRRGQDPVADTGWGDLDSLGTAVPLMQEPRTRYTWTVSVRTDAGEEAESAPQWFETGKLDEPWAARWIGCSDAEPRHPIFERQIAPKGAVRSARLYCCGLGLYELRWNGKKIGREYLTPYCNDYDLWVQYQTYDVTSLMTGPGELSVLLGNGWYKGRFGFGGEEKPWYGDSWKLLCELRLTYEDGTEEVVGTDEGWQVTRSAITFSNIYDGEQRDDTLGPTAPEPARLTDAPKGVLTARHSLPVIAQETFRPMDLVITPAGEMVIDLGQEITGIFRLRVHEARGARIRLQFGEILQNGNFYNDNLRTAKAEYRYISGGGETIVEPRFTFYGYRYVKVEGAEHFLMEDFTGVALYSDLPMRGELTTGNELVNKLIRNTRWGMADNFLDVPTDCPQRDERMGWTGDAQVFSGTALYLADAYAFYGKYLYDMALEQEVNGGMVPNVVPAFGIVSMGCSSAWGDAAAIIPWNLYLYTGDAAILRRQYPAMKAWVDYITGIDGADHAWRRHFHFGDWLALDNPAGGADQVKGATDDGFIADVFYRRSAIIVAKTAALLGKDEEAAQYRALADRILQGIRDEYFSPNGRCCIDTQTAALLTIGEDLSDKNRAAAALERLLSLSGGKLKTGFVGTPLLCKVLTDCGIAGRAYDLLLSEEYPGWLYEVRMGATTIWERWNSLNPDGSISSTGMNSLNHYSYGSVVEWMFSHCAGLKPMEDVPGFRRVKIAPALDPRLGRLSMVYPSAAGCYRVNWEITGPREVTLCVTVPFGCEAELTLPLSEEPAQTLNAGTYQFRYRTSRPIGAALTADDPIWKLMEHDRAREALLQAYPDLLRVPPMMRDQSLRTLLVSYAGDAAGDAIRAINEMLSSL